MAETFCLVAWLVTVITACGTTAPVLSVTVPRIEAVKPCPLTNELLAVASNIRIKNRRFIQVTQLLLLNGQVLNPVRKAMPIKPEL
jgi:hypothetical protein